MHVTPYPLPDLPVWLPILAPLMEASEDPAALRRVLLDDLVELTCAVCAATGLEYHRAVEMEPADFLDVLSDVLLVNAKGLMGTLQDMQQGAPHGHH